MGEPFGAHGFFVFSSRRPWEMVLMAFLIFCEEGAMSRFGSTMYAHE